MASKPPTKKRREDVKEDIQSLQFGEDFDKDDKNVGALFNAEVKAILEQALLQDQAQIEEQSEMMQNAVQYCNMVGKFTDIDAVTSCKKELTNKDDNGETIEAGQWGGEELCSFEAAMLGNLQPSNAEEAKSLIKSLSRFSDNDVEEMCQIVARKKASNPLLD